MLSFWSCLQYSVTINTLIWQRIFIECRSALAEKDGRGIVRVGRGGEGSTKKTGSARNENVFFSGIQTIPLPSFKPPGQFTSNLFYYLGQFPSRVFFQPRTIHRVIFPLRIVYKICIFSILSPMKCYNID